MYKLFHRNISKVVRYPVKDPLPLPLTPSLPLSLSPSLPTGSLFCFISNNNAIMERKGMNYTFLINLGQHKKNNKQRQ